MAYSYGYPYSYPGYQTQMPQVPQTQPTATLQTQIVVRVPSFDVVKTFNVRPGEPVTFFDDNRPYCYVKTAGASPVDPPKIRLFKLVECEENELYTEGAKTADTAANANEDIDLSKYVQKPEFAELCKRFDDIIETVDKIKFDVDSMSDKSTKKMVQKARKDADEE